MVDKTTVVVIVVVCAVLAAVGVGVGVYYATVTAATPAGRLPLLAAKSTAAEKAASLTPLVLSTSPRLEVHPTFMSPQEAGAVIALANNRFNRSSVVQEGTGIQLADPARTSYSVYLAHGETPLIRQLEERAAALAGLPVSYLECLQVVRYQHGQFYKPHFDYLPETADVLDNGQRQVTLFAYLNDLPPEETGGGTHFPTLGKTVRPQCGAAAMWINVTDGAVDPRTLHGGETIAFPATVKYGMNFWFRDRPQK